MRRSFTLEEAKEVQGILLDRGLRGDEQSDGSLSQVSAEDLVARLLEDPSDAVNAEALQRLKLTISDPLGKQGCPYCGEALDVEDIEVGLLTCPECAREGCSQCMPAGRGCICPECEKDEEDDEHEYDAEA